MLDEGPVGLRPTGAAALVDRVAPPAPRHLEPSPDEEELADRGVEREDVHALAARVDEEHGRPEEDVSRRDLLGAGAEEVRFAPLPPRADREDRAERPVHVDVRRAVHRIEEDEVARSVGAAAVDVRLLELLRGGEAHEPAVVERLDQDLVGEDVDLLLVLPLHVLGPGGAVRAPDVRDRELARDPLSRDAEPHQEKRELARRAGVLLLSLEDESIEGDRSVSHRRRNSR